MTRYYPMAILLSALMSAGCLSDDVLREVQLEAVPVELPGGTATGTSDLTVNFVALEHLEESRFVLWAVDVLGNTVAIAEVEEGDTQISASALPVDLADVLEILITEEELGTALPASQSEAVLMRGTFPGPLSFGGLHDDMFADVSGTASIHDKMLIASMEGMPELPAGYFYGISLSLHREEAEHGHAESPEDEHGADSAEEAEGLFLGHLDEEGHIEMTAEMMLAMGSELVVSIESLHGHDKASHIVVMRGPMLDPDATRAEPSSGGTGHTH